MYPGEPLSTVNGNGAPAVHNINKSINQSINQMGSRSVTALTERSSGPTDGAGMLTKTNDDNSSPSIVPTKAGVWWGLHPYFSGSATSYARVHD
jgi:hypothetical protein